MAHIGHSFSCKRCKQKLQKDGNGAVVSGKWWNLEILRVLAAVAICKIRGFYYLPKSLQSPLEFILCDSVFEVQ